MSASGARASKLQKLDQFRKSLPYVSKSALSAILHEVDRTGVPELHSRKQMKEATVTSLSKMNAYGPLFIAESVKDNDGQAHEVLLVNFMSYMHAAYQQGGSFTSLIRDTYRKRPCSIENPWQLCIYADEVTPGNVLAARTARKSWMVYGSFLEYGQTTLQREAAWTTLFAKRSTSVAELPGGISQMIALLLKSIFCNPVCNPSLGGVVLSHHDQDIRIFFKLGMSLMDGGAHKLVLGVKGDSGNKYCLLCKNVFHTKASKNNEDENSEDEAVFTPLKHSCLDLATDAEILGSVSRLTAKKLTCPPAELKLWEQASGINYVAEGLLFDQVLQQAGVLQPVSQYCHDWMHGVCSSGTMTVSIYALLTSLSQAGLQVWKLLADFVALWCLPSAFAMPHLPELFSAKKVEAYKKAKKFKCQASECLALYPVIAMFVQSVPMKQNMCLPQCEAFIAMCDVLDLLQSIATHKLEPSQLVQAVEKALDAFVAAGWKHLMIKKFHWLLHYGDHLQRFKMLPACWSMERKHKLVNKFANPLCNTIKFEQSVLEELLSHKLATLKQDGLFESATKLVNPHPCSKSFAQFVSSCFAAAISIDECLIGAHAKFSSGSSCSKADVVLLQTSDLSKHWDAAEIWAHFEIAGKTYSLVSLLQLLSYEPERSCAKWQANDLPMIIETSSILCCLTYNKSQSGVVTALVPFQFRY